MTEKVGINPSEFQSSISVLRSSASDIRSGIKTNRTFNKTNISPLIKDLEHVIKAIELIKRYQTLLSSDIDTLEQTGEQIKENDERLAAISKSNVNGSQPIRT